MERQVKEYEDQHQGNGQHHREAVFGLLHLLEFAAPLGAVRRLEQRRYFSLRFGDGAGQIALLHAELHRDEPPPLLPRDR